jgi:hypothetical protein
MAADPRVEALATSLQEWQWRDGGWNCDQHPEADHSSFYESLAPVWGLTEYHRATGDSSARSAARRTAELFLRHRLFRRESDSSVIHPKWTQLHYPLYWHYDVLQGLVVLQRAVGLRDPRMSEALRLVTAKRRTDGRWRPEAYYWTLRRGSTPPGPASNVEVVDWGRGAPNEMITLNALRVLEGSGERA